MLQSPFATGINLTPDKGVLVGLLLDGARRNTGGDESGMECLARLCIEEAVDEVCDSAGLVIKRCRVRHELLALLNNTLKPKVTRLARHYFDVSVYTLGLKTRSHLNWESLWASSWEKVVGRVVAIWQHATGEGAQIAISGTFRRKVYDRDVLRLFDRLVERGVLKAHSRLDGWLVLKSAVDVTVARSVTHGERVDLLNILDAYSCARYFNCQGAAIITELPLSAEAHGLSRLLGVDVYSQGGLLGLAYMQHLGEQEMHAPLAAMGG
ncbi:hypothetical protein FHR99_001738 [Litorivivens lipolytica]|uniref:Uncharacterized protein n=1 Tax=Litorivivens lipolytica TaxID=1524264 RepID=A0A7W4W612_9GAMM|nr:hypothetical protein [Litorivivens lipolytica]MBB3047472.1 hypothetical protein [Litorivivens lipolytica]